MALNFIHSGFILAIIGSTWTGAVAVDQPFFTMHPGPVDAPVVEGNRLVMSCGATGTMPISYQWELNDTVVESTGSTPKTFLYEGIDRSNVGMYRCVATNEVGSVISKGANIQVAYFDSYSGTAQTTTVQAGEAKILTCPPYECYPTPEIIWQLNGVDLIPGQNQDQIVTADQRLVLLLADTPDQGDYSCKASNTYQGSTHISPTISLTVNGAFNPPQYLAPTIAVPPSNTVFRPGQNHVQMECIINAYPLTSLTITWHKDGLVLMGTGAVLNIYTPGESDAGVYRCVGELAGSDLSTVEATANLTMYVAPVITSPLNRITQEDAGNTMTLYCTATGEPAPLIRWYRNAIDITTSNNNRFHVDPDGSLTIEHSAKSDSGMLQCQAVNEVGEQITDTWLQVVETAPMITVSPTDTTILEGDTAILQCAAQGAPHPTITWFKDGVLTANASFIAHSRLEMLESGDLVVKQAIMADSGDYMCVATNTLDSTNANATLIVYKQTYISQKPSDVETTLGQTTTLVCTVSHDPRVTPVITWYQDQGQIIPDNRFIIQESGALVIYPTQTGDMGVYTCNVTSIAGNDVGIATLSVLQAPYPPMNVVADKSLDQARTILVSWIAPFDGNSPLIRYTLEQKEDESAFVEVEATIDPQLTQFAVTGVKPSRKYQYRLTAQNAIGSSPASEPSNIVHLPEEPPDVAPQSVRASATSISSIRVEFAEPPYDSWNGALQGYILQWRIDGFNTAYDSQNITSYRTTSYEITSLITWTVYEIRVAAYNGAGVGTFSNTIEVRTHEGVPTEPPSDVVVTVASSTSFTYQFRAPSIYAIHGINQGYKLFAWEQGDEANAQMALVSPDSTLDVLVGSIDTLKKFTAYQTSVLCYTNAGDGVPSTPTSHTTLEDVPGPVSSMRLVNVYDTSLEVAWEQPLEINGALTGYVISWEEHNKTSTVNRAERTSSQTDYTITGLTAQTTYLIQVWAKTAVGPGPKTASIVSSGVPPERPQPPTNLAIPEATIQSRSIQLHFTPGFDGDAGITLWTVEALVGQSETWEPIFEYSDPDARWFEVTGLTPFTHYRLRMIASNVAGASNASEPSGLVLTKQDVPTIVPSDVRVRAYNSTALRVTWVPLDDSEWNGQPGGYLIYWRPSGSLETEMTFNLTSPYDNDYIIGGLEEWLSYDVRIVVYNEKFVGPSSAVVEGWTNAAVPSAGPANIQAVAISYSTILVTWGDVPPADQNGEILGFKVIYRETGNSMVYVDVPSNDTRDYMLMGLKGYTVYTVTVLAYTVVGDGAIGNEVPIRTETGTPSAPIGLRFPTVHSTSVIITWNPPLEPNGPNLRYNVGHRLESAPSSSLVVADAGANLEYSVTGLQPQQTYHFEVTARTSMGNGDVATALVITTTNRTSPSAPSQPSVDHIESQQVRLSWTPGADGNSPFRYYTIDIKTQGGAWKEHSTYVDPTLVSYTVNGLEPFTSYSFRLKVYNDIGASPNSLASDLVTTDQDIPDGAPTITGATPITVTSLLVTWQPPPVSQSNGPLTGFRIQFRQLPGSSFMEETIPQPGVTEYELLNLVKFQNYEVKMAALNSKGLGPYSSPVFVYIGEAVPSEPPSGIIIEPTGSTAFQISWTPPSEESQNGGLQGYKVVYWEQTNRQARSTEAEALEGQQTRTYPPSTTVAMLEGLDCFSEYGISVRGFNAAGDGPGSAPIYSTTEEDVPSSVEYLRFSQVRMSSLNVSWGAPPSPCGVITQYRLFYQPHEPINGERTSVMVTLPSDQLTYTAKRLGERVQYLFQVRAETATYAGPETGLNITTGPQTGAPEQPRTIQISPEVDHARITWEAPVYPGDAPLSGYLIQYHVKGEEDWDDIPDTIGPEETEYSMPYSSLGSGLTYVFRLMAENAISVSEPVMTGDLIVPVGTPVAQKAFYEQWWFLVIVALVGIIVIILVAATLCMLGRSKLYVDKKVHKRMTPDERVSVTEDAGFTSFEMDPSSRRSTRNGRTHNRGGVYARTNSYTRPPPRPSPGSIQYSEEEESKHYEDVRRRQAGEEPGENSSLTEKADLQSLTESLPSESDVEMDMGAQGGPQPSFVNHYASLPGSQSWRRQNPPSGPSSNAYSYTDDSEPDHGVPTVDGRALYLQNNLAISHMKAGSRAPVHGFSSFV